MASSSNGQVSATDNLTASGLSEAGEKRKKEITPTGRVWPFRGQQTYYNRYPVMPAAC